MFKISVGDTLEICFRYSSYSHSTLDPFHIMSCQLSMGFLSIQQAVIGGLLSELMRIAKTCKQRLFDKAGDHIHIKNIGSALQTVKQIKPTEIYTHT